MSVKREQYLDEMGITRWTVRLPACLEGYQVESIELPASCQLLLVASDKPIGAEIEQFEKVLASMALTLAQSLHIFPSQAAAITGSKLDWIWFAGCDPDVLGSNALSANQLTSIPLAELPNQPAERRQLWQQICTYKARTTDVQRS